MKIFSAKKIVDAGFFTFIILSLIFMIINNFSSELNEFLLFKDSELIKLVFILLLMSIVETFINNIIVIIIYIFYSIYSTNHLEKKDNVKSFEKNINYYREIIKDYSPAVLSYIDDFELNYPKDIIAILIKLKEEKKIESLNIDIKDTYTIDCNESKNSEEWIINNLKNNTLNLCFERLKSFIKKEAIELELIESSEVVKKRNKKKVLKTTIIYLIILMLFITYLLLTKFLFNDEGMFWFLLIYGGTFMLGVLPIILYSHSYPLINNLNAYRRTKKGEEIHKKLDGLKNYLKDFSNMNDKDMKDLKLWDDYLIYSVIFDQNKKVIEECTKDLFYM